MCPFSFHSMCPNYGFLAIFFSMSCAFVASFLIALMMMRCKPVHDEPNERSSHNAATPTSGGIAFVMPILVVMSFYQSFWVCAGLLMVAVLGGLDDRINLSYRRRLIVQLGAALMTVNGASMVIHSSVMPGWLCVFLAIFLLMGLLNATNFIDGLNGLLTGCVMIACGVWWVLTPELASLWAVILVSLLGFWILNIRGLIFMGDLGSTFLGMLVGVIALWMQNYHPTIAIGGLFTQGLVITLAPLMFLYGDVVITLGHRIARGVHLAEAHREHFIHRVADSGHGHAKVTFLYMTGTLYLGVCTIFYHYGHIGITTLIALYVVPQFFLARAAYRRSSHI